MSNEQPQILEIKNLSKSYGNLSVLKNLNLSINRGEFIGIVGPNGIGKTTLVGCICGIVKYHSGTIAFHNHQANLTKRHFDHRIGICFQDSTFDRFFPINDSIRFNAMYNGLSRYYSKLRTDYVLNLLRLNEQKNQYHEVMAQFF